jgi:hypothetical protein
MSTHDSNSPHWWGWASFDGHPLARALARRGLVLAPRPDHPSAALLEARREIAVRKSREREADRRLAEDDARLREQCAQEQHQRDVAARWKSMSPQRRQAVRDDVRRYGREVVIRISRRTDPTFDLPSDLNEEE